MRRTASGISGTSSKRADPIVRTGTSCAIKGTAEEAVAAMPNSIDLKRNFTLPTTDLAHKEAEGRKFRHPDTPDWYLQRLGIFPA